MTKDEWVNSHSAQRMLEALHHEQPEFLTTHITQLHRFFIACCWKHKHLIPQKRLRNGLRGAERWLAGEISDDELDDLNWYAEAEAFMIDYAETPEEIKALKELFEEVEELNSMPFSDARRRMRDAAYFAECSMIYSSLRKLPWIDRLFTSQFLCPDLLRKHIEPFP